MEIYWNWKLKLFQFGITRKSHQTTSFHGLTTTCIQRLVQLKIYKVQPWIAEHWNDLRRGQVDWYNWCLPGHPDAGREGHNKYRIFDIGIAHALSSKQTKKENTDITTSPNTGRKSLCHKLKSYLVDQDILAILVILHLIVAV